MRFFWFVVLLSACASTPCDDFCDRYASECGGERELCESSCNEDCEDCWSYVSDTCRSFDDAIACDGCGATWGGFNEK